MFIYDISVDPQGTSDNGKFNYSSWNLDESLIDRADRVIRIFL